MAPLGSELVEESAPLSDGYIHMAEHFNIPICPYDCRLTVRMNLDFCSFGEVRYLLSWQHLGISLTARRYLRLGPKVLETLISDDWVVGSIVGHRTSTFPTPPTTHQQFFCSVLVGVHNLLPMGVRAGRLAVLVALTPLTTS